MDFGDILDQWEKNTKKKPEEQGSNEVAKMMEDWLVRNPVEAKEKSYCEADLKQKKIRERKLLLSMPHQAEIDLHGLTVAEAIHRLENFVIASKRQGLRKILVIHGKGNHSAGEPVLRREVRRFLETCPHTGQFGAPDNRSGGAGAVWILLK
jgi:DNA-nicking Smr family endonuclease